MSFPLWYLLVPFAAIVLFAGLFLFFNLFSMNQYGVDTGKTKALIYLYIGGFLGILLLSAMNLAAVNWNTDLDLTSLIPGTSSNINTFGL